MEERKRASLSGELHLVLRAADGARFLADRLSESRFHDTGDVLALAGVIVLVRERLRLVDRAVRGEVDPRLLWCSDNDAIDDPGGEGSDVVFAGWCDRQCVRHHKRQIKAAKRRLRLRREK